MGTLLLTNGDNPSAPKIIFFPEEQLPPPHPEPPEPPKTPHEIVHDINVAVNNLAVDLVVAFEPLFKALNELAPKFEAIAEEWNKINQEPLPNEPDKRRHAKQDLANKRRLQRGGKWKAF